MKVGDFVWGLDVTSDKSWCRGTLIAKEEGKYTIRLDENGKEIIVNQDQILEWNAEPKPDIPNMVSMNDLNEASMLYNLSHRYFQDKIYTYIGSLIVAINPYKLLPHLYANKNMQTYQSLGRVELDKLEPHLFALANRAYLNIIEFKKNQSFLINGESGSGKTESTKTIIKYLAFVSANNHKKASKIEEQLISSSPIMEAFGNACTIHNNNSSRFGKFISISFDDTGNITGAKITDYLLEKSRVVYADPNERSYHVFYQITKGATDEERQSMFIGNPIDYEFLKNTRIDVPTIGDKTEYLTLKQSMNVVGFSETDQRNIFSILSAILHLGNIKFVIEKEDEATILDKASLEAAAQLLGLTSPVLGRDLTYREMESASQNKTFYHIKLNRNEAIDATLGLAKALYKSLFSWIISQLNLQLQHHSKPEQPIIGVLDIFGFEIFESNSLEQLLINYANEKLQQQYLQHALIAEQEEYIREGIEWEKINIQDNKECVALIENKPGGILTLLNEECVLPRGSDQSFLDKLLQQHAKHPFFIKPKVQKKPHFIIRHYASEVSYVVTDFLNKNKDRLYPHLVDRLTKSKNNFVANLFNTFSPASKQPMAEQFKIQLATLNKILSETEQHYVRCISPNKEKAPSKFMRAQVLYQIKCCGLLENVRIRKAGFAFRTTYELFVNKFRPLISNNLKGTPKDMCEMFLKDEKNSGTFHWKGGTTKVFLGNQHLAFLEKLKEEKETYATLILQRAVLVVIARQKYEFLKAEKKRREEEERRKREEEERKRKQEEEKRRKDQEEERRKREEEERKRKQEEKRRKDQEEERKRNQEELERKELEKKHKEEEIFKSGERNWEISHWWYGSITREEAEAMLKGLKGYSLFVVRETVAKGKLAISAVNREKKGNHFLIHWRISHENGKFSFEECPEETAVYSSLQELIMKTPLLDRYQPLGKFKN